MLFLLLTLREVALRLALRVVLGLLDPLREAALVLVFFALFVLHGPECTLAVTD